MVHAKTGFSGLESKYFSCPNSLILLIKQNLFKKISQKRTPDELFLLNLHQD
jgi:hypothetical protein